MTLIRSISGIRGTIGGRMGQGLTPMDVVLYTSAYGQMVRKRCGKERPRVVLGRDARPSGPMVRDLVVASLVGMGIDVIDLGMATTPTVEMAVTGERADGGIILTASHNPKQWNALKLLNEKGEFISAADGKALLALAESGDIQHAQVDQLGTVTEGRGWLEQHIDAILALDTVDVKEIKEAGLRVVVDAVNSVGGIAVPELLNRLGVALVIPIHCDPNGQFPHNPEPLPEHLQDLSEAVMRHKAHVGISVDPDVDRLAMICENGAPFGEEYTLVACAHHVLRHRVGATVSNLSSTRALRDVTEKAGGTYHSSAVGEVNVVARMKEVGAVIGGEGNGGVIVPELHYGRDALAGIALFLTALARSGQSCSAYRASFPEYHISKNRIELAEGIDVQALLDAMAERYKNDPRNTEDGLKIELGQEWVHMRMSNTEPIIRIYSESKDRVSADDLGRRFMSEVGMLAGASVDKE